MSYAVELREGARKGAWEGTLYCLRAGAGALRSWLLISALIGSHALVVVYVGVRLRQWVAAPLVRGAARDLALAREFLQGPDQQDEATENLHSPDLWNAIRWMCVNALLGLSCAVIAIILGIGVLVSFTCLFWWWALPTEMAVSPGGYPVDSWGAALTTPLVGLAYLALNRYFVPRSASAHAHLAGCVLLRAGAGRLRDRLAEANLLRQEALEAHGMELRRIERDLHDGTQNRLVAVRMHLGLIERVMAKDPERARELMTRAKDASEEALRDLRAVVRSIYPPILADQGLAAAVSSLASRSGVPCEVEVGELPRLPAAVEAAAYFVVTESLTNVAKHSGASQARVRLSEDAATLTVTVDDDGEGGADEHLGSGLSGIRHRVAAFDGRTRVTSPPGGPTVIEVRLPCAF